MGLQLSRPLWEVLSNKTIMKQFVVLLAVCGGAFAKADADPYYAASSATRSLSSSATRRSPPSLTPPPSKTARTSPSRSAPSPLSVLPIPPTLSDTLPVWPALLLLVVLDMVLV